MINTSNIDCLVVGAGFCGSVIARKLAEKNKKVLVLDRRNHIAGNMYDEVDTNGILVQQYGPHIFHTNSGDVYDFILQYGAWDNYRHQCAVDLGGIISPSPANFRTIDLLYNREDANTLKTRLKDFYGLQRTVTISELLESHDLLVKEYAKKLFTMNYRPYTVKQWGIPPEEIDPGILKRVPVRLDYTDGYFDDIYQALPEKGYTRFFGNLLDHKNIEVLLNTDALDLLKIDLKNNRIDLRDKPESIPVVYTGAIDELLDYRYGTLPYRSLTFNFQTVNADSFQNVPVVAYPSAEGYTRITEYKKLPVQNIPDRTTIAYEYPLPADRAKGHEPYYPILTDSNIAMYNRYLSDTSGISNLFFCGRLADYKYYNMDTAIARAFEISPKVNEFLA